jgi:hypothetical protein
MLLHFSIKQSRTYLPFLPITYNTDIGELPTINKISSSLVNFGKCSKTCMRENSREGYRQLWTFIHMAQKTTLDEIPVARYERMPIT